MCVCVCVRARAGVREVVGGVDGGGEVVWDGQEEG